MPIPGWFYADVLEGMQRSYEKGEPGDTLTYQLGDQGVVVTWAPTSESPSDESPEEEET